MTPNRTSDELLQEFDASMTRLGRIMAMRAHEQPGECKLTFAQMMLLGAIDASDAMKMSDVAAMMSVKPPAASAMIDALAKLGYCERSHADDDRRVTLVHLTADGKEALVQAEAFRLEATRKILDIFTEDDIRGMIRLHQKLLAALEDGRV